MSITVTINIPTNGGWPSFEVQKSGIVTSAPNIIHPNHDDDPTFAQQKLHDLMPRVIAAIGEETAPSNHEGAHTDVDGLLSSFQSLDLHEAEECIAIELEESSLGIRRNMDLQVGKNTKMSAVLEHWAEHFGVEAGNYYLWTRKLREVNGSATPRTLRMQDGQGVWVKSTSRVEEERHRRREPSATSGRSVKREPNDSP